MATVRDRIVELLLGGARQQDDTLIPPPANPAGPHPMVAQGARSLAQPIWNAVTAPGDALQGKFAPLPENAGTLTEDDAFRQNVAHDEMLRRGADLAGMVMGGTYAGAPAGAIGAGAVRRGASVLPMDEASRMARAKEQGFTTPAYHGTRSAFDEFGRIDGGNARGKGYYFSTSPETASNYAVGDVNRMSLPGNAAPNVLPVQLKATRPFDESAMLSASEVRAIERAAVKEGQEWKRGELLRWFDRGHRPTGANVQQALSYDPDVQNAILRRAGYDSRIGYAADGSGNAARDIVVFEPNQIRSRFAAFNPANKDSGFLLGSGPTDKRTMALVAALLGTPNLLRQPQQ